MSNTGFGEEPPLCAFRKLGKSLLALILHYALLTFSLAPCITLLLFFTSLSAISNQYSAFIKEVCNFRQKTGYCIFIPALPLTSFGDLRQAQSFSGPHTSDLYNEYNIYAQDVEWKSVDERNYGQKLIRNFLDWCDNATPVL